MTEQQSLSELAIKYKNLVDISLASHQNDDTVADQILACLINRDQIAYLINKNGPPDPETAQIINIGDHAWGQLLPDIQTLPDLPAWRQSFTPPESAWWWPEPPQSSAPLLPWRERFNWLWTALALILLTISLSLMADITSRFLDGNTDAYGIWAVIVPTILTLLTTRSILTETGQEMMRKILNGFKSIPADWREELGFLASILLLLFLILFWWSLPAIARSYNNSGYEKFTNGEFAGAIADYNRALALNPNLLATHYNLGNLYEDLNNVEQAKAEYELAVQGYKLDAAYNNLARLYILDEKYDLAMPLLLTIKIENLAQDQKVKYDVQKNLGWARFGQGRYREAAKALDEAIELDSTRAPAFCLLAQVYEAQKAEAQQIEEAWTNCIGFVDQTDPDEDRWLGMARQYFEPPSGE